MAKVAKLLLNVTYNFIIHSKNLTMKKILFSIAVALGVIGISVSNFGTSNAQVPTSNHSYIVKDTVPSDTTYPKDSTTDTTALKF